MGITPADAGKTLHGGTSSMRTRDHPRGCGENFFCFEIFTVLAGSPPRMRGKHQEEITGFFEHRITPADAGKTVVVLPPKYVQKDHPRGCGENSPRIAR